MAEVASTAEAKVLAERALNEAAGFLAPREKHARGLPRCRTVELFAENATNVATAKSAESRTAAYADLAAGDRVRLGKKRVLRVTTVRRKTNRKGALMVKVIGDDAETGELHKAPFKPAARKVALLGRGLPRGIRFLKKESGVSIFGEEEGGCSAVTLASPPPRETTAAPVKGVEGAFVVRDLLSPAECDELVRLTNQLGYSEALVTTYGGRMVRMTGLRNNQRVIWQLARQRKSRMLQALWERVRPHLPPSAASPAPCARHLSGGAGGERALEPCGLNERLRFYKYRPGERFRWHFDGAFYRRDGSDDRSMLTLIIYLTDGFKGGATNFNGSEAAPSRVEPERGMGLLFWHGAHPLSPEHEGEELESGEKYVLRTDVMFGHSEPPTIEFSDSEDSEDSEGEGEGGGARAPEPVAVRGGEDGEDGDDGGVWEATSGDLEGRAAR